MPKESESSNDVNHISETDLQKNSTSDNPVLTLTLEGILGILNLKRLGLAPPPFIFAVNCDILKFAIYSL